MVIEGLGLVGLAGLVAIGIVGLYVLYNTIWVIREQYKRSKGD